MTIDRKAATEPLELVDITGLKLLVFGFQLSVLGVLVTELHPLLFVGLGVSLLGLILK